MILINKQQLEMGALMDESHKLHSYAREYDAGIKYLKRVYGDSIKFVRPGYPRKRKGVTSRGKEVPNMARPTPPMTIPLSSEVVGEMGTNVWGCALSAPELLPNGLYDLGSKRSMMIFDDVTININKQPDLAFFLYYKSPFFKSGLLKIDNPDAEAKLEGDRQRAELELQTALYGILNDEDQLKVVAQSYGIAGTEKKHSDVIRKELKAVVLKGEQNKKRDATAKGIGEFLSELKVTDAVRLRSLIKIAEDKKMVVWYPDGKYKVGERELCRVPTAEIRRRFDFLCNHLGNAANRKKLQELIRDVADKEYLDGIKDEKTFIWLARMMELPVEFKKQETIVESIYGLLVEDFVTSTPPLPEINETEEPEEEVDNIAVVTEPEPEPQPEVKINKRKGNPNFKKKVTT